MSLSTGKKKKKKGDRYYKEPSKRLKERFDPEENLNFTSQADASVDKAARGPLVMLFAGAALLAHLVACTPRQQTTITKTVSDVALCIETEAADPTKTPLQIATTCGLDAVPDVLDVVSAIAAKQRGTTCSTIVVDGGAPPAKGPGI